MKIAIIINAKRLTPQLSEMLNSKTLTEKYNIHYDLFLTEPQKIEDTLKKLNYQAYNACLIGGGDGTVRTAAQILIDQDLPLIVLPLGTFNVLAKQLNYPNNIDDIFAIIKNNKTKQIDLAEVNGNIIINHAWIGFYYYILKMREKHPILVGRNKVLKIVFNLANLFKFLPKYHLKITKDNKEEDYKTCLIFIGNNESYTNILDFGARKTLSSGLLSVILLKCVNKWQLLLSMLGLIFDKRNESNYFIEFNTNELTITTKHKMVNMVIDGELFQLESPLHFVNHKKTLTVLTA